MVPGRVVPVLTLWQPWASLIAIGAKPCETRGKVPPARLIGRRIAIHAALRKPRRADLDDATHRAMAEAFRSHDDWLQTLPRGMILCTAILREALPVDQVPHDLFGDYSLGRWAWQLEDLRPVDPHVPAKGTQTWGWPWQVPDGVTL